MKKRIQNIIMVSILLCALAMFIDYNLLNDLTGNSNSDFHFNLLTVNSIIAGFMFTSLGILLSVSNHDIIKKLRQTSIIDKKNGRIVSGLTFSVISIFVSLIFIFKLEQVFLLLDLITKFKVSDYIINYLAILGVTSLITSIIYFGLSIKDINFILNAVRASDKKLPADVVTRLKDQLQEEK